MQASPACLQPTPYSPRSPCWRSDSIYRALIRFSCGHWCVCLSSISCNDGGAPGPQHSLLTSKLFHLSEPASFSVVRIMGERVCKFSAWVLCTQETGLRTEHLAHPDSTPPQLPDGKGSSRTLRGGSRRGQRLWKPSGFLLLVLNAALVP